MLGPSARETFVHPQDWSLCFPHPCRALALKPHWPSKLNALGVLPLDSRPSDCLGRVIFMWEHPCVSCVGLIFFGASIVFSIDDCHLFPQCMLAIIPLIGDVTDVVAAAPVH